MPDTRDAVIEAVERAMRDRFRWSVPLYNDDWRQDAEVVADAALRAIERTEAISG